MFHPAFPIVSQKVEAEAISFDVYLAQQLLPETNPLRRVYQAFEYRLLHPLSFPLTHSRDAPKTPPSAFVLSIDVIRHNH
jgi:hypothetical protein